MTLYSDARYSDVIYRDDGPGGTGKQVFFSTSNPTPSLVARIEESGETIVVPVWALHQNYDKGEMSFFSPCIDAEVAAALRVLIVLHCDMPWCSSVHRRVQELASLAFYIVHLLPCACRHTRETSPALCSLPKASLVLKRLPPTHVLVVRRACCALCSVGTNGG